MTGVIKLTGGDYNNTHLSSWRPCSFSEWKDASPLSFFDRGVELRTDAIYKLPSSGYKFLPSNHGFIAKMLYIPDKPRAKIEAAAAPLPKPLVPRVNGRHPSEAFRDTVSEPRSPAKASSDVKESAPKKAALEKPPPKLLAADTQASPKPLATDSKASPPKLAPEPKAPSEPKPLPPKRLSTEASFLRPKVKTSLGSVR